VSERLTGRSLKQQIKTLLTGDAIDEGIAAICRYPARRAVNPLFSFFHHTDILRWHAIAAMGVVAARLYEEDQESARVVMRRLMWTLNDESGGIGWGSPEAMGAIMAQQRGLAEEYHCILISYLRTDGNFLELPALQQGVLWGVGHLARSYIDLIIPHADSLLPFLATGDPILQGLAVWAGLPLKNHATLPYLRELVTTQTTIPIYRPYRIEGQTLASLAQKALHGLSSAPP
jgi:hypothetical protein